MIETTDSLESIIDQLKARFTEKKAVRRTATALVRNLLDRYEKAADAADVAELARILNLRPSDSEDPASLALELMIAVEKLPDFQQAAPEVKAAAPAAKEEVQGKAPEEAKEENDEPMAPVPGKVGADYIEVVDKRAGTLRIPKHLPHPRLAELSQKKPIYTVGGLYLADRDRWIKQMGIAHEWLETTNAGGVEDKVKALCARIAEGKVGGVILLNELIGHNNNKEISTACKKANVLQGTARKGQQGSMKAVIATWERSLTERAEVR